jgi:hypothetical protein
VCFGHGIGGDGKEDAPVAVEQIHRGCLGANEVHDLAGYAAEGLGKVRLGGQDACDRDERLRPVHVDRLAGEAFNVARAPVVGVSVRQLDQVVLAVRAASRPGQVL